MNFGERLSSENSVHLLNKLYDQLLNESQRGAVLIASTIIQNHLKNEIELILPKSKSNRKSKEFKRLLFSFPGPMSSFSGLILLSFTFGYINRKLYDSLNLLRVIRNDAAHLDVDFSLDTEKYENKFNNIFKLFDNDPFYIHDLSVKALFDTKVEIIKGIIDKEIDNEIEREKYYKDFLGDSDRLRQIEKQKYHWVLIYGTLFICNYISDNFERNNRKS